MRSIKAKDIMTKNPYMIAPDQTVQEAARIMKERNFGILPVGTPEAVIGMLTDRDITVRVTAEGKNAAKTLVQDVMSKQFVCCNEADDIERAAWLMRSHDVGRIMVANLDMVTGIITLADLLRNKGDLRKSDQILNELLSSRS